MGIGTSLGAFYKDEKAWAAAPHLDKDFDSGILMPESTVTGQFGLNFDENIMTPHDQHLNKQLDDAEMQTMGLPVKGEMPFPNNSDPRTDFDYRFPKELPPAGILNDLKRPTEKPLQRKVDSGEVDVAMNLTNTPEEIFSALEGGKGHPAGNASRGGPTNEMKKQITGYHIWDNQNRDAPISNMYKSDRSQRRRAQTRADKMNLEYGAHRYSVQPVWEDIQE